MHKNARLTPRGRALMLERLAAGQHQADVAQAMGVSLTTLKKWLRRYRCEGVAGLQDRSSRPRRSPRRLDTAVVEQIVNLRRQRRTGRFIAAQLAVSGASVSRVLRRVHLSRWRELEPRVPIQRYERERAGELLHLDVKKLGRITRIGHRITGDRHGSNGNPGWEFVHVAVDDASRVAVASVAANERGDTATTFLEAAVSYFEQRGIRIERVMTDNGSAYRSHTFRDACQRLAVSLICAPNPTHREPTAKPNGLFRPACGSGLMPRLTRHQPLRTTALRHWLHHYNSPSYCPTSLCH